MHNLEGMLVVDQRGDIRVCSGSLARWIGRAASELTGQPVWSLLPGWTPFGDPPAESRLRLLAGGASISVHVSWNALHLPGETLFMLEVRGSEAPRSCPGARSGARRTTR